MCGVAGCVVLALFFKKGCERERECVCLVEHASQNILPTHARTHAPPGGRSERARSTARMERSARRKRPSSPRVCAKDLNSSWMEVASETDESWAVLFVCLFGVGGGGVIHT